MQKRVQQFSPSSGPRKTKEIISTLDKMLSEVLDDDANFIDKDYKCTNPFGKCEHCQPFL